MELKEEHKEIIRELVEVELNNFEIDTKDAKSLRYKANLIEISDIFAKVKPISEIAAELKELEKIAIKKINGHITGRPKGSIQYSPEQVEFLKKCANLDDKSIIIKFNRKFGTEYPENSRALYNFMKRNGMLSQKGEKTGRKVKFTKEVLQFIRDNLNGITNDELVIKLKNERGVKTTESSLSAIMTREGIKRKARKKRLDEQRPNCVYCKSSNVSRWGYREIRNGKKAKLYKCADCGEKFITEKSQKSKKQEDTTAEEQEESVQEDEDITEELLAGEDE